MIDAAFVIPGDIDAATGGYAYARKVLHLLPEFGVAAHHIALPGSFPEPSEEDLAITRRLLEQLHPSTPVLFDGLAYGALPPGFLDKTSLKIAALVHHPLAFETGVAPERRDQLMMSERAALAKASSVIATSPLTGRTLIEAFGVNPNHLTIAEPGTRAARRALGTGKPFTMLAVGSLIPRKGYNILVDALGHLTDADWRLVIVGSPDHDPVEANRLREQVLSSGLRSHIEIAGKVSNEKLQQLYAGADLFVMPSLYEGYGMVLAEAMARGLAIVCTTGGAAAETAPDAAAIKVPPGDDTALAQAIETVMRDTTVASALQAASWEAGCDLPRWPDSVEKIANVIKAIGEEHSS